MTDSDSAKFNVVTEEHLRVLGDRLINASGECSLSSSYRTLFTLKSLCQRAIAAANSHSISTSPRSTTSLLNNGTSNSESPSTQTPIISLPPNAEQVIISLLGKALHAPTVRSLLRHELAYVLGQIGSPVAIPILEEVLSDVEGQEEMVRHESAEALAALDSKGSVEILRRFVDEGGKGEKGKVVRETCQIALRKIEWNESEEGKDNGAIDRKFTSIDPAPPFTTPSTSTEIDSLKRTLLDVTHSLFDRYRAMFSLRNIGTPEAIDALSAGFLDDNALFKHEIAFIMGQLSHPHSIPALVKVLERPDESPMVRHEAAEALGGIAEEEGSSGQGTLRILREWRDKPEAPEVVRESCIVAVDMWEYENSKEFEYANGLL
ncbi:armadillo-type protein [Cantharellus anzutake]|uniref:armadillo-type protein n=1 Tax=Cantharellus anzutake TaxID=1750568 RepID=UPI0019072B17|nr:armadillo-type protein [Cantharellus anzutake]KAF8327006.1 armadillo-type protein [Cantharellus anzutake]